MTDRETEAEILARIKSAIEHGLSASGQGTARPNPPTVVPSRHLAQLAHELKTPLSAIVAAAEIMRDERLGPIGSPLYRGYAGDIHESASHALGVIAAMLAPSAEAGRAGRDAPSYVELDLNELVRRLASSVRALLGAAGLEIETVLEPSLPHVIADPVTVRQLLLNLVTNAMRATLRGGRIGIVTHYKAAGELCVGISDTGTGLSADDIRLLLDPARTAGPPGEVASQGAGMGFGYPLMHQLAAINGAALAIESVEGTGTLVTVSFAADRVVPV